MGWLKPADGLLEPKGYWDAHRDPPPDGPVPEPAEGCVADGKTVRGVRIGGAGALAIMEQNGQLYRMRQDDVETRKSLDCTNDEFVLDEKSFDYVPIALLLGVPLMFKRLVEIPTEGEGAEELRYETKMYVYKLMTTPGLGLPLTWNQNGAGTKLPPVLVARSDGVPFTQDDWACLVEFHEWLDENYVDKEHLYYTNKAEFKKWVGIWTRGACLKKDSNCYAFAEINPCFESRFPIGLEVRAVGLAAKPELNGRKGTVQKYDEAKLRVGVEFAPPFGLLAIKHSNLELVDPAERSSMLLEMHERKPKGKTLSGK